MNSELRLGLIALLSIFVVGSSLVFFTSGYSPFARITEAEDLREQTAAPKTEQKNQTFNLKEREEEWSAAQDPDRAKSLPAWSKILNRFRFNVVGGSASRAMEQLRESEAWHGKITKDRQLDKRIIEAAVLTHLNSQDASWRQLSQALNAGASNDELDSVLTRIGF